MRTFADLESARVVSFSDLNPEKLTLVRRRHAGVEVTTEFRELPADPRVDAVAIVTAVNTHYQVALAALKAGKHCAGRQAAHSDFCAIASLDRVMFINDRFPHATADSGKFAAAGRLETGTDTGLPAGVDRIACDDLGTMICGRRGRHQDVAPGAVVIGILARIVERLSVGWIRQPGAASRKARSYNAIA